MPRPAADERLREIAGSYPTRTPRADLGAVEWLAEAAGIAPPKRRVVVVGTNGKTSTAVFLGRLLLDSGVTVSPHLTRWGERVTVRGREVEDEELLDAVERLHGLGRGDLRFFDLLTLAAAELFARHGVGHAVFEAGIGGRDDATRILEPPLVVLTGIGLDHVELLGPTEEDVLRAKLDVAPRGARVVSARLGRLEAAARTHAAERGLELELVDAEGDFRERNRALASAAAGGGSCDLAVRGRLERLEAGGVEVILDAAHNEQAWREVAAVLPAAFVAVVSVSLDREPAPLRVALRRAVEVVATEAWAGRSHPAPVLAAAVGGTAVGEPAAAVLAGLRRARALGLPLVVLGSTYLLAHAYGALPQ